MIQPEPNPQQVSFPSLASALRHHGTVTPDATSIVHLGSGGVHTYGQMLDTARRLITVLADLGVGKKDKVAFAVRNHWLHLPLLIACSARRAILVPIDPELHRDALAYIVDDAAPAVMIVVDAAPSAETNRGRPLLSLADFLQRIAAVDPVSDLGEPTAGDVVLMIYTSGTTGSTKCVMLTDQNLVANATALANRYGIAKTDRYLCTLPTHHMNAIMMTGMVPLMAGASVVLGDILGFKSAKLYWKLVADHGVTIVSLVPSIMALLLKLFPRGVPTPVENLRLAFCGAAPLSEQTWRTFESTFGVPVYQGYGLTETTCWAVSTLPGVPHDYSTVGEPLDGCEIRIDETTTTTTSRIPGASGEVLIKGPIVGAGYFKNPKLTQACLTADGAFRTGDLGFVDDVGELRITGRIKEIIIKNGANVFAPDLDQLLAEHPAIESSKTIGLPDALVGERICCVCVLKEGHQASDQVTEQGIRSWLQERLSRALWPDVIEFVGALPRGGAGKVMTNLLRQMVTGELADDIVASLGSWKYKRAQASDDDAIRATIQRSLMGGRPIPLLAYWGCGARASIADVDRQALVRLKEYSDSLRRVAHSPAALTLILTDSHAANNHIPAARSTAYFDAIAAHARNLDFAVVTMTDLWRDGGLSTGQIDRDMTGAAAEDAWQTDPLRSRLIDQARKHVEGGADVEGAAWRYRVMCRLEGQLVAARHPDHIFITYNPPEFDAVSPGLPKVYLSSFKAGTSVKPWFHAGDTL
jgi:long-chain acyl-CoA synthetase